MSRWMMPSSPARCERRGHLTHDAQDQQHLRRSFFHQVFAQVASLDVFEGHVRHAVGLADGEDLDDVGVGGLGDGGGFVLEARQGGGIGSQFGPQDLEGDLALEGNLFGEVNLAHAAPAEMTEDAEIGERSAGQVQLAGQGAGRQRMGLRHVVHDAIALPTVLPCGNEATRLLVLFYLTALGGGEEK